MTERKTEKPEETVSEIAENSEKYEKHYDETSLFEKIASVAKKAGIKVIFIALLLFYSLKNENMPLTVKAQIVAALGYFIFPFDLIPDFIPVLGYSDDLAGLLYALKLTVDYVDDTVFNEAENKIQDWFNDVTEEDLKSILNTLNIDIF